MPLSNDENKTNLMDNGNNNEGKLVQLQEQHQLQLKSSLLVDILKSLVSVDAASSQQVGLSSAVMISDAEHVQVTKFRLTVNLKNSNCHDDSHPLVNSFLSTQKLLTLSSEPNAASGTSGANHKNNELAAKDTVADLIRWLVEQLFPSEFLKCLIFRSCVDEEDGTDDTPREREHVIRLHYGNMEMTTIHALFPHAVEKEDTNQNASSPETKDVSVFVQSPPEEGKNRSCVVSPCDNVFDYLNAQIAKKNTNNKNNNNNNKFSYNVDVELDTRLHNSYINGEPRTNSSSEDEKYLQVVFSKNNQIATMKYFPDIRALFTDSNRNDTKSPKNMTNTKTAAAPKRSRKSQNIQKADDEKKKSDVNTGMNEKKKRLSTGKRVNTTTASLGKIKEKTTKKKQPSTTKKVLSSTATTAGTSFIKSEEKPNKEVNKESKKSSGNLNDNRKSEKLSSPSKSNVESDGIVEIASSIPEKRNKMKKRAASPRKCKVSVGNSLKTSTNSKKNSHDSSKLTTDENSNTKGYDVAGTCEKETAIGEGKKKNEKSETNIKVTKRKRPSIESSTSTTTPSEKKKKGSARKPKKTDGTPSSSAKTPKKADGTSPPSTKTPKKADGTSSPSTKTPKKTVGTSTSSTKKSSKNQTTDANPSSSKKRKSTTDKAAPKKATGANSVSPKEKVISKKAMSKSDPNESNQIKKNNQTDENEISEKNTKQNSSIAEKVARKKKVKRKISLISSEEENSSGKDKDNAKEPAQKSPRSKSKKQKVLHNPSKTLVNKVKSTKQTSKNLEEEKLSKTFSNLKAKLLQKSSSSETGTNQGTSPLTPSNPLTPSRDQLVKMNKSELKEHLRERSLTVSGNKKDLIDRLLVDV